MCRQLRDKAITNLDAAMILKEQPNRHHCSSIHCSYYSCFQAMKYIAFSDFGLTDADILTNRDLAAQAQNGRRPTEHDYLINYLYKNILQQKALKEAQEFSENINKLKSLRNNSDYTTTLIEKDKSDNAYTFAEAVHKILKRIYKYDQN